MDMRPIPLQTGPPFGDEPDYEEHVLETLHEKLPEGVDIKTCDDFKQLGVECCETCHRDYPHYEMSLIDLPDGGKAWVCDHVKWALFPEQCEELRKSPLHKRLKKILCPGGKDSNG